ncbi:unnamed protein product [Cylicocyclus nassatus]|uniref:Uncharacterized protein n=1 Tax=Cylicocyclus nassatus TaxID=53992 RepID=A0AA36MC85_CYLNA|nr:unnamed protein product [Cylicocyclus nassatus]
MSCWLACLCIIPVGTIMSIQLICVENDPPVENTSAYHQLEQLFSERMDEKVHPCDNFYQYACGKFNTNAGMDDDISVKLTEKIRMTVTGLLIDARRIPSKTFELAQHYYRSCLQSHQALERLGGHSQFVIEKIRNFGYFPLVDDTFSYGDQGYKDYVIDLTDVAIYFNKNRTTTTWLLPQFLMRRNDTAILQFFVDQYSIFQLSEGTVPDTAYPLQTAIALCIETYSKCYMQKILKDLASMNILLKNIVAAFYFKTTEPTTLGNLNRSYSSIDMFKLLSEISSSEVRHIFQDGLRINAPSLQRIARLDASLQRDPKAGANIIIIQFVCKSLGELDARFRVLSSRKPVKKHSLRSAGVSVSDKKALEEAWCFIKTQEKFGQALLASYARSINYTTEALKLLQSMFNDFRNAFFQLISEKHWSSKSKELVILRMAKLRNHLGLTDVAVGDLGYLDSLYEKYLQVNLHGLEFVDMEDVFNRINLMYEFSTLNNITAAKNHFKRIDIVFLHILNGRNMPWENRLQIFTTLLHFPMFLPNLPRFYNYASIGSIISHEMMHSYDNTSIGFDENGNHKTDLSKEFLKEHWLREECMQKMYEDSFEKLGYKKKKLKITVRENFADTQGIKLAFKAYQNAKKREGKESRVEGLPDFTEDQLFFLAYSQFFCLPEEKKKTKAWIAKDQLDTHSPKELRVNTPLANMVEFSEAFHCSPNSAMNSAVRRCEIFL